MERSGAFCFLENVRILRVVVVENLCFSVLEHLSEFGFLVAHLAESVDECFRLVLSDTFHFDVGRGEFLFVIDVSDVEGDAEVIHHLSGRSGEHGFVEDIHAGREDELREVEFCVHASVDGNACEAVAEYFSGSLRNGFALFHNHHGDGNFAFLGCKTLSTEGGSKGGESRYLPYFHSLNLFERNVPGEQLRRECRGSEREQTDLILFFTDDEEASSESFVQQFAGNVERKRLHIFSEFTSEAHGIFGHSVLFVDGNANLLEGHVVLGGVGEVVAMVHCVLCNPIFNEFREFGAFVVFAFKIHAGAVVKDFHVDAHFTSVLKKVVEVCLKLCAKIVHVVLHGFFKEHGHFRAEGGSTCSLCAGNLFVGIGIHGGEVIGDGVFGTNGADLPVHIDEDVSLCDAAEAVQRTFLEACAGGFALNELVFRGILIDGLFCLRETFEGEASVRHENVDFGDDIVQIFIIEESLSVVRNFLCGSLIVEGLHVTLFLAPVVAGKNHEGGFLCLRECGEGNCEECAQRQSLQFHEIFFFVACGEASFDDAVALQSVFKLSAENTHGNYSHNISLCFDFVL